MRVPKHYLIHEDKVNENKALSYCEVLRYMYIYYQTKKKLFSIMSNLRNHYHFKLDFQEVDQHTGGKWEIHGTKHRKEN